MKRGSERRQILTICPGDEWEGKGKGGVCVCVCVCVCKNEDKDLLVQEKLFLSIKE